MGHGLIACWLAVLLMSPAPPEWHEGLAVRYAEGVMEAVARNRGIAPAPCMIAYTHAANADMGVLWLEVEGVETGVRRRCLAVDLPRPGRDKANLIRRDILVELDHESGRALCGAAWSGKATECRVRVRRVSAVAGRVLQKRSFYAY